MTADYTLLPQYRRRQRDEDWVKAPLHHLGSLRIMILPHLTVSLVSGCLRLYTFPTGISTLLVRDFSLWRHDPMRSWMIINVLDVPDSGARNSHLSAGIGQSRQALTAFLRRTSVKLSYIFKPSEPGTTGAMEESLLGRSPNLTQMCQVTTFNSKYKLRLQLRCCLDELMILLHI